MAKRLRYPLGPDAREDLFNQQGGACAICKRPLILRRPDRRKPDNTAELDHSHVTGFVRGFLCRVCNVGIGYLSDDPKLLRAAAQYLEGCAEEGV